MRHGDNSLEDHSAKPGRGGGMAPPGPRRRGLSPWIPSIRLPLQASLVLLVSLASAASAQFTSISLSHSLSQLPGSSHRRHSVRGRGVMSDDHAQLAHRIATSRSHTVLARMHRRRLTQSSAQVSGFSGVGNSSLLRHSGRRNPVEGRRLGGTSIGLDNGGDFLPLGGNFDPQVAGLYWTEIQLGDPPKRLRVQVDTGSNLIWVSCQPCLSCATKSLIGAVSQPYDPATSSSPKPLDCGVQECSLFQKAESHLPQGCLALESDDRKCYYWLIYGDSSSTTGYMLRDQYHFSELDGTQASVPITFGCGYNQTGNLVYQGNSVDGLLGLGTGAVSFRTQMQLSGVSNGVLAVCLGGETTGGGTLVMGIDVPAGCNTTTLYTQYTHYAAWISGISVAGRRLDGVDSSSFSQSSDTGGQAVFDTGTTLSIVPESVYNAMTSAVAAATSMVSTEDSSFTCYDFNGYKYEDLPAKFPEMTLHFEGGDMVLPPHNYLFLKQDGAVQKACFGWVPGSSGSPTIFGDVVLHDFFIAFDVDNGLMGWVPFNCSNGTISASNGEYNISLVVGIAANGTGPNCGTLHRYVFLLSMILLLVLLPFEQSLQKL